jgi:F-type H+-transporting ATPase subunit b
VDINMTLIGQTIAMIVFVWFCMKYIWPPIMLALDERRKTVADGLAAAEKGQQALAEAQTKYEEKVHEARDEAAQIIAQANKRSAEIVEEARSSARKEGEKLIAQAKAEIDMEAARARDELRGQVAAIAMTGARQLLGRELSAADQKAMLDQLASEL